MKKFFFAVMITIVTLASCKKDDSDGGIKVTGGQINQTVYADENKGASEVTFETTGSWTSRITEGTSATRSEAIWISITPASGNVAGNYTIKISLLDNYTGADRTATITITCNGNPINIIVKQKATTEKGEVPRPEVGVTGIWVNKEELTLIAGDTETLTATVTPEDATNQKVTWTSTNEAVATVDQSGKVNAISEGTAKISVTTDDGGKTAACNVIVKAATVPVSGVRIDKDQITLTAGETETLTATITPDNATNKKVTWASSNTAAATIDQDGKVSAVSEGTAAITVTTEDGGKSATCHVLVKAATVPVTSVSLNKEVINLTVGDTETLTAVITPENATNKGVAWSSNNPGVATVENGKITAIAVGKTTISAITDDGGKVANCSITVADQNLSVEINGLTWATRNVGEAGQFVANSWDYGGYYTFEEAQNACPSGWRTPTKGELESLVNAGSVWATVNGITGRRFGSGSNTIFIPAAGWLSWNGTIQNQGMYGWCWSSTILDYGTLGYFLYFRSSHVTASDYSDRQDHLSVRCVHK